MPKKMNHKCLYIHYMHTKSEQATTLILMLLMQFQISIADKRVINITYTFVGK